MHFGYFRGMFALAVAFLLTFILFSKMLVTLNKQWSTHTIIERTSLAALVFSLGIWMLGWVGFDQYETGALDLTVASWLTGAHQVVGYCLAAFIATLFAVMTGCILRQATFLSVYACVVFGATVGDYLVINGLVTKVIMPGHPIDGAIVDYYVKRPHMLLHAFQLFLAVLAGCLTIGLVKKKNTYVSWPINAVVAVSILFNEAVLWIWRYDRL